MVSKALFNVKKRIFKLVAIFALGVRAVGRIYFILDFFTSFFLFFMTLIKLLTKFNFLFGIVPVN